MARNRKKDNFTRGYFSTGRSLKALEELGPNVLQAAKIALAAGAEEIVKDAKSRVPVKTGALRDSIHAVPNRGGTAIKIRANAKSEDGQYYGQYVEFDPRINQPFLYPAFDAKKDKIRNDIIESIKGAVRNIGH